MSGIPTRTLSLKDVVSGDQFLCWAEVGYMIGEFYSPLTLGSFADFVKTIPNYSGWDTPGNVEDALDAAKVDDQNLAADYGLIRSEIAARSPVLLKSNIALGHVRVVVGVPIDPSVQSVELMDPQGKGFSFLMDWKEYIKLVGTAMGYTPGSSQLRTRPRRHADRSRAEGHNVWVDLGMIRGRAYSSVDSAPDSAVVAIEEYFQRIGCSLRLRPTFFPLWSVRLDPIGLVFKKELIGYRSIFRRTGLYRYLVVDLALEGNTSFSVMRLMTGSLVDLRVGRLDSLLDAQAIRASTLYFEDWWDFGLDVAIYQRGAETRPYIRLFGPRGYYGLRQDNVELDALTFQTDFISSFIHGSVFRNR